MLSREPGLGVLVADVGVGKTSAMRHLCAALPRPDYHVVYLRNQRLGKALSWLQDQSTIQRTAGGWQAAENVDSARPAEHIEESCDADAAPNQQTFPFPYRRERNAGRGAMIAPHLDFRRLKRTVAIEQVLDDNGWLGQLRRRGGQLVGPCPIHRGDNPNAFVAHVSKKIWRCFTGGDAGGDLVELARRLKGGSYSDTAAYLATLADAPTPDATQLSPPLPARPFRPFTRRLPLDPTAPFLQHKGIRPHTARRFESGLYRGPGFLSQAIGVRLHDPQARPLGYAARRLDPQTIRDRGKWNFPSRLPKNQLLYNYHRIPERDPQSLLIVECPWGVMRLDQVGIPAVALLGTHFDAVQQKLLQPIPHLILMMDGDLAGRNAASRIRQ